MKLQRVKIQKYKVIENLDQTINGKNILIIGENGVGKSSLIQFIQIALGQQSDLPSGIEEGKGKIWVDKDGKEWTFTVEFKKGRPVVTVEAPDGMKDNRKSVLASVVGAIDFDINEFVEWSENSAGRKKQVETYLSLLPQDVKDFIENENKRVDTFYKERTEINRDVSNLEGALAEHPYRKNNIQVEKYIDPVDIQKSIDEGLANNNKITAAKTKHEEIKRSIKATQDEIAKLTEKLSELNKSDVAATEWLANAKETDLTELMKQKDVAYENNKNYDIKVDYLAKKAKLEGLKETSGERTALIDTSKQLIEDAIKDCDSPVKGLSFDAEGLIYNGVPVTSHNLSTSEIIELGAMLKMAENPDLGILFIQNGESLGNKRLSEIQKLADTNGWQIVMEQVERGTEKLKIEIWGEESK